MSGDWELRPAGPDEFEALVEVCRAEDLRYRGRTELDVTGLSERLGADANFDAAQDQVIAVLEGRVVAAALIRSFGAFLAVHPEHEVPGLRASVLSWMEWRQAQMGRRKYTISVPALITPTVELLARAGWTFERAYVEMLRDFSASEPPQEWELASGHRLRHIDPVRDARALHALNERAFGDRPDHLSRTLDEYTAAHLLVSKFAPEWSVMIETDGGEAVASAIGNSRPGQSSGYLSLVGVDPAHRQRGLARALLLASFAGMHRAGRSGAGLHVATDNDSALALYRGVGMHEGERILDYSRTP